MKHQTLQATINCKKAEVAHPMSTYLYNPIRNLLALKDSKRRLNDSNPTATLVLDRRSANMRRHDQIRTIQQPVPVCFDRRRPQPSSGTDSSPASDCGRSAPRPGSPCPFRIPVARPRAPESG